jgi:hypothetical protein
MAPSAAAVAAAAAAASASAAIYDTIRLKDMAALQARARPPRPAATRGVGTRALAAGALTS